MHQIAIDSSFIGIVPREDEAMENIFPWSIYSRIGAQRKNSSSQIIDFLCKELKGKEIKIGLVNINEGGEEEWKRLGETSLIRFVRVPEEYQWENFFPEWINEERWPLPKCPEVPMPRFREYNKFDVIVSKVPCGSTVKGEGIRDVFRLQVNLVVANLVVRNGRRLGDDDRPVFVVFMGSCGPMWEIFRCDDLLRHEGDFWIYKPDLRRLKQKLLLPVGTCQLALPYVKQDGKIHYKISRLGNPIDHPREAYATILHTSEKYVCGAIALAQSIIQTNSTKDLVLFADKSIKAKSRQALQLAGWKIKLIERIRSPQAEKDAYNKWNYSKLRLWQLIEYDKIIFIDSDLILLRNLDKFFVLPQLTAVGNDKVLFNSGVMVVEPSECMFEMLMNQRHSLVSYNGGDQGFLNEAFTWWHRLPKTMNFLKMFDSENKSELELPNSLYAIHYLGWKPWMCYRDYDCNWDVLDHQPYASDLAHKRWWKVYDSMPKSLHAFCQLSKGMKARIQEERVWAKKERLADGHWKINVKDPRQNLLY